jgi:hypothetical protein
MCRPWNIGLEEVAFNPAPGRPRKYRLSIFSYMVRPAGDRLLQAFDKAGRVTRIPNG